MILLLGTPFLYSLRANLKSEQQIGGRMIFAKLKGLRLIHVPFPMVCFRFSLIQPIYSQFHLPVLIILSLRTNLTW